MLRGWVVTGISLKTKITLAVSILVVTIVSVTAFFSLHFFAPLYKMKPYIMLSLLPLIVSTILIIEFLMKYLTAPLRLFARHVEELPHKEGREKFLRISTGGEIGALVASFNRMVAELDQQKEALQKSEELYRTIVDSTSDFVFWRSADGKTMLYVSPRCEHLTGYPDAEFYRNPGFLDEIVHPSDRDKWHTHLAVTGKGESGGVLELRLATREGEIRWVSHICRPVFDKTGAFQGVRGSFSDITDRKRVEKEQQQQLHLLQILIDAIPGPVFYKDAQGVYLGCNRAFETYTGLAKADIIGKTVFEMFPVELANVYYEADNALFRRPGVQCYEAQVMFAEGTLRDVMFYKSTFANIDGSLGGLVGTLLDITERKKTEDALRLSEEKFRLFFEESRDAIFVADQDGRLINANQSVTEMFGYPMEEILGLRICETFCDPMCRHALMEELGEKGYVREVEVNLRKKDGTTLVCLLSASLRRSELGEVFGIQGIFHDITERKRAEEVLVRHNEYLAALNETTKGLISRLDLTSLLNAIISRAGALMKTNHSYIYLLNRAGDRMVRESSTGVFTDFFDFMIKKGYGLVGKAWETGLPLAVDDYQAWSGRLPDPAREVLRAMIGIPLKSGEEVVGIIGLAHMEEGRYFGEEEADILTRFAELASLALDNARLYEEAREELQVRKRAEVELRKLSHAVEQSPVSVVITDPAGNIEYVNPKFTETTGYTSEEVMGKNPRILKSGEIPATEYETLWQSISAGHEWRGEFHNKKKGGELYWELASISPIRDGEGGITHFIAVKEDITDRKKLENQLRHSQKMDAVGKLAGGIAHDFNNIMTAIIGYASILDMKLDPEGPFGNSVKQILFSAKRAANLTEGLLAFSRKQITNPQPVQLNDIVRRVGKILERLIGEDIELKATLAESATIIMADSLQIEQVLMNLATNARDAMPDGGRLSVATDLVMLDERFIRSHGLSKPGPYAKLTVADRGIGMDEDTVKKIFDPFFTTKEVGKGTGLGLSIVYGIVEKHDGSISCYSEPGMGAIFTLFFPAIQAKVAEAAPETALQAVGGTETILMAEDDGTVRIFTRELLEDYGYTFIEAADGEDAVEKFREHQCSVQLLILDLIMPRKNGREAYEEIKKLKPDIKVIFSSGYEADIINRKGMLAEGLNYLAKPVTPKQLLAKIREALDT